MIVEISMDDGARRVFAERTIVLDVLLKSMTGLQSASVTLQKNNIRAPERYTLDAGCEADDLTTALKAVGTTMEILTKDLMHTVRRLPEAWSQVHPRTQQLRYLGALRVLIMNESGQRAAAQRGHDG